MRPSLIFEKSQFWSVPTPNINMIIIMIIIMIMIVMKEYVNTESWSVSWCRPPSCPCGSRTRRRRPWCCPSWRPSSSNSNSSLHWGWRGEYAEIYICIAFFHLPIFLSISFLSIYSFIYESVIFRTMMLLCIAYSCNVGGTGTIIGNTPRQLHHNRQLAIW